MNDVLWVFNEPLQGNNGKASKTDASRLLPLFIAIMPITNSRSSASPYILVDKTLLEKEKGKSKVKIIDIKGAGGRGRERKNKERM